VYCVALRYLLFNPPSKLLLSLPSLTFGFPLQTFVLSASLW
jgi:hypothetical protein